jgi:acyl-CoA thioesterase FadM
MNKIILKIFAGICLTRDVDTMLDHMNNARYFRELDLARIDFYLRTGLYDVVRRNHGQIVLGSANIRFRKFIRLFARFKITTKVIYWDDDSIFLEHRFVGTNGVIHAILLCQQKMIKCSGENVMNELLKKGTTMLPKPDMPMEVIIKFSM